MENSTVCPANVLNVSFHSGTVMRKGSTDGIRGKMYELVS